MATTAFGEYLDKKHREARKQLGIVKDVLEKGGLQVIDHREEEADDPYLYLRNPVSEAMFKGVRIYKIGDKLAFRIQREERTFPYGKAYALNIPKLFNDLVGDNVKEEVAGKMVMEMMVKEMQRFFTDSQKAEKELQNKDLDGMKDPLGKVLIQSTGPDYETTVQQNAY